MSAPLYDPKARRAALPRDAGAVIENLIDGATALQAQVTGWPYSYLRESAIVSAERQLLVLQSMLVELRAFVPGDRNTTPPGAA